MLYNILNSELSETIKNHIMWDSEGTNAIISALDNSLIDNSLSISTVHWAKQYPIEIKRISMVLSELGYCNSISSAKWSELQLIPAKILEFYSQIEIDEYKMDWCLDRKLMRLDTEEYPDDLVRLNGKVKRNGARRPGFARVAKTEFKLDRDMLKKYRIPIEKTLLKSIEKSIAKGRIKDKFFENKANYTAIARESLDFYIANDNRYNLERNIGDSRNRANFQGIKRLFNPISEKDCRALLISTEPILVTPRSTDALDDIYYFIAELAGIKSKLTTEAGKIFAGKVAYRTRRLPELNLELSKDRKDLHELMWLERIYRDLDIMFANDGIMWNIPLEVDASMSLAQIAGAVTNDIRLLQRTNVVGKYLSDPWFLDGVRRLSGKKFFTPSFYGSSASPRKLLTKADIDIIPEELKAIRKASTSGDFAIINMLKNAFISNYTKFEPQMEIKLWNDTFIVECNKFKSSGTKLLVTEAWNTKRKCFTKSITREVQYVPDYDYFKLFMATLFTHGIDNQIMDRIACLIADWMITIHDAVIALPGACKRVRGTYANLLQQVNTDRFSIVRNFRESIGATSMKANLDFMRLDKSVQQAPVGTQFSRTAMK